MFISESLKTEVKYNCDVLVCGGGVAGIAAAVAAARSGKQVILAERQFLLGGLATAGLVTMYLALCDGMGRQVSFGLAQELLELSIEKWHDNERGYCNWVADKAVKNDSTTPRYEVNFNPQLFALSSEQLLLKEGVKILYGTTAVATAVGGDKLDAVIFENKSGRFAIKASSFVDASGDADLAELSGAPTAEFKQGNVLAAWYYYLGDKGYTLKPMGAADIPDSQKGEKAPIELLTSRRFRGLDGEEISQMVCMSHQKLMDDLKGELPATVATIPQLRMTRRIVGEYILDDCESFKRFDDSIGMVSDWRKRGPIYEVPFGTLYSARVKNLLFAGRITSVTDAMWDIMRVIPCCAVTGEAAGVAAAISDDMTAIDISALQKELEGRGVKLHL